MNTTVQDIIKKVRLLEIKSKRLANNIFAGEYHSAFKGKGMAFKEVREYAAGDDVRFIDWNVSARLGQAYSKLFEEERELTVMLLIDISNSALFGTAHGRKKDIIAEIAAVIGFSAVANGDKVGAIFYSSEIELYIPPKKGRDHILFILRNILTRHPKGNGTHLETALRYFFNVLRSGSTAFILSDFVDDGYSDMLKLAGKKHDVVGIKVYDKMDQQLPDIGLFLASDAETGAQKWIDSSSKKVRRAYEQAFFYQTANCSQVFQKAGASLLHIKTGDEYIPILDRFFKRRSRK